MTIVDLPRRDELELAERQLRALLPSGVEVVSASSRDSCRCRCCPWSRTSPREP